MTTKQGVSIPIQRSKLVGIKSLIHERRLKLKSNQASSSNNELEINENIGSEMLIDKDTLISSKNEAKVGNCIENNGVKLKGQQTSEFKKKTDNKLNEQQAFEFEKNAAMPQPARKTRKRKRKKRALKNNELPDCLESLSKENLLSDYISSKNAKSCEESLLANSPASTGPITQSIFRYKNSENNNKDIKTSLCIPFSLSDDPSSASLEGVTNNLPLPLISRDNSKDSISLGDKSSTMLFNSSTENKNKTILISSSCSSNMNNVLNVSVLNPCEITETLTESSKCEEKSSLNEKTIPMRLKKYICSQPFLTENLISQAKSGMLKTNSFPIPHNVPGTLDEYSDTDSYYQKSSPSLLENYYTPNEFTFKDGVPKPCSKTPNLSKEIINGKEILHFKEIQNSESKNKKSRRDDLHNANSVAEYMTSKKIIPEESDYVTIQSFNNTSKPWSTKFFATPMKDIEVDLDSDRDGNASLITPKQTSMNLQQEIFTQNNNDGGITLVDNIVPVPSSSQSLDSSYCEEYLNEEGKICLGRIVKVVARHYKVPMMECVYILRNNSFNILHTMQELQLKRYNSENSNNFVNYKKK